jgi:REP-associated tyrosine transposase
MPQSLASLHVHVIFSTKSREPLITPDLAPRLYEYAAGIARAAGCRLILAGGMPDHVHLLVSLGRETSVAEFARVVKANSSRWIHGTVPGLSGFAWQSGYAAFAVSYSLIETVREYIARQEEHHRKRSFLDEVRAFLRRHRIEVDERYMWD